MALQSFLSQLSFSEGIDIIKILVFVVLGMTAYSFYVYNFYGALSKKDIFPLHLQKHAKKFGSKLENAAKIFLYILEYIILFPIFVMFWFTIISIFLIVLSTDISVPNILLLSMGLVATIRITAYYHQDLSKDLAKLVPFAMLAIFLTDISKFSLSKSIVSFLHIPFLWKEAVYYTVFVMLLEFVMRLSYDIYRKIIPENETDKKED